MAKPRNNSTDRVQPSSNQRPAGQYTDRLQFVDGYLTDTDRQWLEDNIKDQSGWVLDLISDAREYGGLSVKFDAKSGRYLAILFGGDSPETNQGYALTARSATTVDAVYALAYKHYVKFARKWGGVEGERASRWD